MTVKQSLPGPEDITRVTLPNGIVILARPNFNSPSVVVNGYFGAGSLFEAPELAGLSNFTAAALLRGTQQRTFQQIYEALESAGASLGFSSGVHTTSFGGRALVEDLDLLLGLIRESVQGPVFPSEHIERLRTQFLTHLAIRAQNTGEMASQAFDEIIFAGHPYSRPEDGTVESVQAIQRQDILNFHNCFYGPKGCVIAIVGGVEPQKAVEKAQAYLGDWTNPDQPDALSLPPITPLEKTVRRQVTLPGKSQSDVIIGTIGPHRASPDYVAASVGNNILGQFGMYGRIGRNVREKAGLAYYAFSHMNGGIGPGVWFAGAGVDPANVNKAIDLIQIEFKRFSEELVADEELADTQDNFIGRLPLGLESNGGVAGGLCYLERHRLGLDYYYRYAGMVRRITKEDVLETARRYLDTSRMAIGIAGS